MTRRDIWTNQEQHYQYSRNWRKPRKHFPWAYIIVPLLIAAGILAAHLAGFGLEKLP